jgi:hypothetical protein
VTPGVGDATGGHVRTRTEGTDANPSDYRWVNCMSPVFRVVEHIWRVGVCEDVAESPQAWGMLMSGADRGSGDSRRYNVVLLGAGRILVKEVPVRPCKARVVVQAHASPQEGIR